MNRKWLVIDSPYLCHRAKHTMGDLEHDGKATGVVYGFLKDVVAYTELLNSPHVVFCWDSKTNKRKQFFPEYKSKRANQAEMEGEELRFEKAFRRQMKNLRRKYLKAIGYRNVFCQKGYESDDLIASVCDNLPDGDEAVIISCDHDLYQLISPRVSFFNPRTNKVLTLQGLKTVLGITPAQWVGVKAMAGCMSDNVPGIKGVGETTAINYILGRLKEGSKILQRIREPESVKIIERNMPLVSLPFPGTKKFKLREDRFSEEGWKEVCKELGMKSLRDVFPGRRRRKMKRHG